MSAPASLSVVVGLISGRTADLERCLVSLHDQTLALPLEIVVPYDDPCADVLSLAPRFPAVKFLRAEGLDTRAARAGASREHHDTLRTIGLRAATGDVVALIEDHAFTARNWCEEMVAAFERHPKAAAIGGAVECKSDSLLVWAVWFCDFGRYQNPLPERVAEYVSDSNVAYRREALTRVADAWRGDYHETSVHWAMTAAGYELITTPRAVVWQARGDLTLASAPRERFVWARSFAGTRARLVGSPKRWIFAILSPLLPLVMTWRFARTAIQRGAHVGKFVACLPLLVFLLCFWALGECVGYLTADPD